MADSPRSILARLEQLKQWQEKQQRDLLEKHLAQQQLLQREQQKMYEVLGLQQSIVDDEGEESYDDSDESEPEYEETNLEAQLAAERQQQVPVSDESTLFDPQTERPTVAQEEALQRTNNIPKRRFLKRGEGLRARFKVDPDKFKLDNLPKYKYANHNRERSKRMMGKAIRESHQSDTGSSSTRVSRKKNGQREKVDAKREPIIEKKPRNKSDQGITLDINKVQDKKLKNTRRIGGSLPAVQSQMNIGSEDKSDKRPFAENMKTTIAPEFEYTPAMPDVPWKRRLDPTVTPKESKEQRELNFFELLEQKVIGKSFNSNSSSILRFIAANESSMNEETISNDETICEQLASGPLVRVEEITTTKDRLAPSPSQITINGNDGDGIDNEDEDNDQAHVHFADDKISNPPDDDSDATDLETYNRMRGMTSSRMSTPNDKLIHQSASLQSTGREAETDEEQSSTSYMDDDGTVDSANGRSEEDETTLPGVMLDDALRSEILAKSELLKQRLTELEREIDGYRRENAALIQAKQEHELERLKLQQDRVDMEERMNDERIKMEVYFHDERMRIETERKQALREAQKPNRKDRDEILRLNEQLTEVRKQQKERETKHSATLARFRAQVKTIDKDLQGVRLELEVMKKDNRRLETENARLKRQNNGRMLVEINRNIAKLASGTLEGTDRTESKEAHRNLPEDRKQGTHVTRRVKSEQDVRSTQRNIPKQIKAKVTNHAPPVRLKNVARGTSLPIREENFASESDDNEESELNQSPIDSSEEENFSDDKDNDGTMSVLGEHSSSAPEPDPSSYFPKTRNARKTLFNPEVMVSDGSVMRTGLVRKENPHSPKADLLDRTSETAEMIKSMKREIVNADGSRDVWYPNGNLKKVSPDGLIIRMLYFNKDIKETNMTEGTTKYYYFETNTWHTTYLDGLEILEFPDGQTEHRFKDGSTEVHFPNGSIRTTNPNSADIAEEWKYPDGTTVIIRKNDDKEINLPNGQVEIHTHAHKRRIYPDGTIKFVYPDGSQESRYSNGRIRLKDKDGQLISDTGGGTGTGRRTGSVP